MHFSRIDVVASAGNLPPEQVRVAVSMPLERLFLGLPAVRRVTANSGQGSADLRVEFDPATDPQTDLQYVDAAIARARDRIPSADGIAANVVLPE